MAFLIPLFVIVAIAALYRREQATRRPAVIPVPAATPARLRRR